MTIRLGTITEIGAAARTLPDVAKDLREQVERRSEEYPLSVSSYLLALGSADLTHIGVAGAGLEGGDFANLNLLGTTSHDYVRTVGVACPGSLELELWAQGAAGTDAELESPPVASWVRPVGEVLDDQSHTHPLIGLLYAKLSTAATLALGGAFREQPRGLPSRLVGQIARRDAEIWKTYELVRRSNPGVGTSGVLASERLRVAPLVGLDSVELVLVIRAMDAEDLAAMAWAVRRSRLGEFFPHNEAPAEATKRAAQLIRTWQSGPSSSGGEENGRVSNEDREAQWNGCPLFQGSATTAALKIGNIESFISREPTPTAELVPGEHVIAHRAELSARVKLRGSGFAETFSPWIEGEKRTAPEPPIEGQDLLVLFDRQDLLQHLLPRRGGKALADLQSIDLSSLRHHLYSAVGIPASDLPPWAANHRFPEWATVSTEIAVCLRIPSETLPLTTGETMTDILLRALKNERTYHLLADEGWAKRAKEALRDLGVIYPVVNGFLKMLSSTLEYAEEDFDAFVDVLMLAYHFVKLAESRRDLLRDITPVERRDAEHARQFETRDLLTIYEYLESLAHARGRHDHPLRRPRGSLSFEGYAGYRVPRAAFGALVESTSRFLRMEPQSIPVVLDSSTSGLALTTGPGAASAAHISAMALHHPLHWMVGHELAHALFSQGKLLEDVHAELSRMPGDAAAWARDRAAEVRDRGTAGASVHKLLSLHSTELGAWIVRGGALWPPALIRDLRAIVEEVAADMVSWETMRGIVAPPNEHTTQHQIDEAVFWFVWGPSVSYHLKHERGGAGVPHGRVGALMLRTFIVSALLSEKQLELGPEEEPPLGTRSFGWVEQLGEVMAEVVACLETRNAPQPVLPRDPTSMRILALIDDLPGGGTEDYWIAAAAYCRDWAQAASVDEESMQARKGLFDCLARWLSTVRAIARAARPRLKAPAAPRDRARRRYTEYLGDLLRLWWGPSWTAAGRLDTFSDRLAMAAWPHRHARQDHPQNPDEEVHGLATRTRHGSTPRASTRLTLLARGGAKANSRDVRSSYIQMNVELFLDLDEDARWHRASRLNFYLRSGSGSR